MSSDLRNDMLPRIIAINIGNSNIQGVYWEDEKIIAQISLPTHQYQRMLKRFLINLPNYAATPVVISCVVPSVREWLEKVFAPRHLHWVSATMEVGLDFTSVDAATVGADRVANAVAAIHLYQPPIIILDCGTAITTEVIDTPRRFLGGAILPGRELSFTALSCYTGQLPKVEPGNDIPNAIGKNTKEALQAGIDIGVLGAVKTILQESQALFGKTKIPLVAVGGDRHFFARHLPQVELGPDLFTINGIIWIAKNRLPPV